MTSNEEEKPKTVTGAELVEQSKVVACQLLADFRKNHDLCVQSGFFSEATMLEVDSCAVSFRQMGLDTVTVAQMVSTQWLDTIIIFYQNLKDFKTQEEAVTMLQLLGGQAKELGLLFKVIAAWARDLAGRLHQACTDTTKEAEAFVKKFKEQVAADELEVKNEKAKLKQAQADLKAAQADEKKWATAQCATCWNLIGLIVTSIGLLVAEKKVAKKQQLEYEAEKELASAQKTLAAAEDKEQKAEYIATVSAHLVKTLSAMEITTEAVATFWTEESNTFISQGQKMMTNETKYPLILLQKAVGPEDIKSWQQSKAEFQLYVDSMTAINNSFNYPTPAKAPEAQEIKLDKLDFTIHVPSTIDVKAIMDEKTDN